MAKQKSHSPDEFANWLSELDTHTNVETISKQEASPIERFFDGWFFDGRLNIFGNEISRKKHLSLYGSSSAESGISTIYSGLADLDIVTGGFKPSQLIFLAGRPYAGQTFLSMNIVNRAAIEEGIKTLVFNFGRDSISIARMLILLNADASHSSIYFSGETPKIRASINKLVKAPLIMHTPFSGFLPDECRKMHEMYGFDFLAIIDFDLYSAKHKFRNCYEGSSTFEDITTDLKKLAVELNIPVLVTTNLSRRVELRMNHRPRLTDLKEGSQIKDIADIIILLYEDFYYRCEEAEETSQNRDHITQLFIYKDNKKVRNDVFLSSKKGMLKFSCGASNRAKYNDKTSV